MRYLEKVIYEMNGRLPEAKTLRVKSVKITGLKSKKFDWFSSLF